MDTPDKCQNCGSLIFNVFFNEDEPGFWHRCASCGKIYKPIHINLDTPHPSGRESKQGNVPT